MKITIVTPTGDRPHAFALCERYMQRQSRPYDQWLVLDDGQVPTKCTLGQTHVQYNASFRGPGSLVTKLAHMIDNKMVRGDVVAFIEDDDWYHLDYLGLAESRLRADFDMIGEGHALYYNVRYRWWYVHPNEEHASLCQTMLRTAVLPKMRKLLDDTSPFIDFRMWNAIDRRKIYLPHQLHTLVGIKSMPGRAGYGSGHRSPDGRDVGGVHDDDWIKLQELIGTDVEFYKPFYVP